jgi:hypothetical protein
MAPAPILAVISYGPRRVPGARAIAEGFYAIAPQQRRRIKDGKVAEERIPKPTRTTVVVAKLVGAGHIEITATARK